MTKTAIEWAGLGLAETGHSYNPIRARNRQRPEQTGHFCRMKSEGCPHCYSRALNTSRRRNFGTGIDFTPAGQDKIDLYFDYQHALTPWKNAMPTGYFPCDCTDWLGRDAAISEQMSYAAIASAALAPWHRYLFLTKRYEELATFVDNNYNQRVADQMDDLISHMGPRQIATSRVDASTHHDWGRPGAMLERLRSSAYDIFRARTIWLGISLCTQQDAQEALQPLREVRRIFKDRGIDPIIACSYEPALEAIDWQPFANLLDWLILGGESDQYIFGQLVRARAFDPDRARQVSGFCEANAIPMFFKQMGNTIWLPVIEDLSFIGGGYVEARGKVAIEDALRDQQGRALMHFKDKHTIAPKLDGREWREFPKL